MSSEASGEASGSMRSGHGARTSASGTPVAVDVSADRRSRVVWAVLLVGPVVGLVHFLTVYLVAEAGCTGDGPGLSALDPPVPDVVTLVLTGVAVVICALGARWAWRRWRAGAASRVEGEDMPAPAGADPDGVLAFAGFLLSSLFAVAVLFVGLPTLALPAC